MFRFRQWMSICILVALVSVCSTAQKITGDVSGTVTDSSSAAVNGAAVTAVNSATGETRSATTSDTGFYRIVELPPGNYHVTVKMQGFKTTTRDAQVTIARTTTSDFSLQPGAITETVEVQGVTPLVDTTENRLDTVLESRQVEDLPNNGRDFNNLLDGVAGVQRSPGGGFQSLNINGQRATSNNFAIDGIPNNDRYYGESALGQAAISGTAAALISLEGISEFSVQSNPGVEYGVRGGSVISIGLKSGTNQVHGSAFWDRHTDAFDARNWFATSVTPFKLNQFGGNIGFPIKKDKTFLFVSFQGFHLNDRFPALIDVPTPAEIFDATQCVTTGVNPGTADYSNFPNPGLSSKCINNGPGPGPDQIFGTADDGQVNTIGANILSLIPTSPTGKFNVASANKLDLNNFHVKFDQIFNSKHRVSVKYLFSDSLQNQPAAPGVPQSVGPLATNHDMWNSVAPSRAQLAGINYTWTITPTKILESRVGYTRFSQRIGLNNNINPADLGANTGPLGAGASDTENFAVPTVYYLGYFGNTAYGVVGGIQGYPIITRPNATYDWQEHFTMIKGNHTIKIGGQFQNAYTKSRRDRARSDLSFGYYGMYYCAYYGYCDSAFLKATPSDHVASLNQLLLGLVSGSGRSFGVTNRRIFQKSVGVYVQDSWKVKPNFTLEAGLRWDVAGALGETKNQGANFLPNDPKADANGFVSLADHPLYNTDMNNFGPRIGIAWDIFKNGKTVLRAGYSLNYDLPNFGTIHAPQTFFNAFSGTRAGFFTQVAEGEAPIQIFSTPASNQAIFNSGTQSNDLCIVFICVAPGVDIYGQGATPPPPYNVVQMVRNFQTPMNHAFNVTVEQELRRNIAVSVAYVGTKGRDLVNWRDLNACPISTDPCEKASAGINRRPFASTFPQYRHILQLNNDGYSDYDSFQLALKVRNIHGITGQFNYVYSRSRDTGSANRGGDFLTNYQNPYNVDKNYAPSNFDTPWNVNFTLVYDVPKFHAIPEVIGGGWSINSIFRAQEGRPFTAFVSGDPSNQGLKTTYADYDGSPLNYDFHNPNHYFNTGAFSEPASGTIGNAGRNSLRQPGISQLDVGIFKTFKLSERFNVRFSWMVFNAFNHAMFATTTPGKITSGSFGTFFATPDVGTGLNPILGTGAQRNMQFGLKFSF